VEQIREIKVIIVTIKALEGAIEAMLFASGEQTSASVLAQALELDEKTVKTIITRLSDSYEKEKRGLRIIQVNEAFQMCTSELYYDYVSKLVKIPVRKNLTVPLLETLAIVAYKQPVTKSDIEDIRGVSAEHAINKLIECGLVCECGRLDSPGRPILFATTDEFLKYYGYRSLSELPEILGELG
jgi:segregation and condensation protein B